MSSAMQVRRGFIKDTYAEDGRCAVFVNGQVVVLSEIATVILEATPPDSATTLDEITAVVVAQFGEPEPPMDAVEITRAQVFDLMAHQVLVGAGTFHDRPTPESVAALTDAVRHLRSADPTGWQLPESVGNHFIGAVRKHRLAPALARSLDRLELSAPVAAQLRADDAAEATMVAKQVVELHEILSALDAAGVRALAFKGLALAAQAHGDHGARGKGDHDILIHPADLGRAHAALTSIGWMPAEGFARPGDSWAWRHLVRNYYELTLARGLQSLDLHWHLGPVRAASPSFDELWARRAKVMVGTGPIATFSAYDALAHSAMHAAKDHWASLRGLLDIHRLISEPATWREADRPLGRDQLLSVGLAALLYGIPAGSPPVVAAAAFTARGVLEPTIERHSTTTGREVAHRVPGSALVEAFAGLHRAGARPSDHWRYLQVLVLPITDYTREPTRLAVVAVPRVLVRRGRSVTQLWRSAIRGRRSGRAGNTDT